jgi:hypothetical protein
MSCARKARGRLRRRAALAVAFPALLGPDLAVAAEAVQLEVACAELTSEERAAVEARARTELIARSIDAGRLTLHCEATSVSAAYSPSAGEATELRELLSPEPKARVDQLVALVGQLLEGTPGPALGDGPPPPSASLPADEAAPEPGVPAQNAPLEAAPARSATRTTESAPARPLTPSTTQPRASEPHRAAEPSVAPHDASGTAQLFGATFDPWWSEIAGTAGAFVGAVVPLAERLGARATATVGWGTSRADDIAVRHLLVEGALEAELSPWVLGAFGGGVSALTFDSDTLVSRDSTTSFSPVAHLAVRLAPGGRSAWLTLGPVARYYFRAREAAVAGDPVLQAPRASVAFELEGRFD